MRSKRYEETAREDSRIRWYKIIYYGDCSYFYDDDINLCLDIHHSRRWNTLLEVGKDEGLIPCGLGARDTLRLEAAMPLYGHEMNDELTPKEAGIGFFVKMDKPDFIGKQAILDKGTPTIKRVGLVVTGRGIAREHCPVFADGKEVGMVTSGTHCPFIGKAIAMAYLPTELAVVGNTVQIDVRGRKIDAEIIKLPFYKKPAKA